MAEVLVFDRVLNASELLGLGAYLSTKFGTPTPKCAADTSDMVTGSFPAEVGKKGVLFFGWVFVLISFGSPHVLRARMGGTCADGKTKSSWSPLTDCCTARFPFQLDFQVGGRGTPVVLSFMTMPGRAAATPVAEPAPGVGGAPVPRAPPGLGADALPQEAPGGGGAAADYTAARARVSGLAGRVTAHTPDARFNAGVSTAAAAVDGLFRQSPPVSALRAV